MTRARIYAKIITENKKAAEPRKRRIKMAENKNIDNELEVTEGEALYITLTDENGKELEFEVIGEAELDGVTYYAMVPAGEAEDNEGIIEYVLLKKEQDEDGEDLFITLDDEDEFEKVANYFDELFDSEVDYDA